MLQPPPGLSGSAGPVNNSCPSSGKLSGLLLLPLLLLLLPLSPPLLLLLLVSLLLPLPVR